ncbi:MAG: tetratricopeptide repeat protein, partial [Nannocystaceae bacterium]
VHLRAGDLDRALASFDDSLEQRRSVLPPGHPDLALSQANLGRVELERRDPAAAVVSLREAARGIDASLGPRHPLRALVATILGSALTELGRWREAEAELELAAAIDRERAQPGSLWHYHQRRAQGQIAGRRRRWDEARWHFEQALAQAEPELGDDNPMLVDSRLGLARAEIGQGNIEDGTIHARRTVDQLVTTVGAEHPFVAEAQLVLAELLLEAGQPLAAAEQLVRARAAKTAADDPDPIELAVLDLLRGRIRVAQGDEAGAEPVLRAAYEVIEPALPSTSPLAIETARVLGETLLARGDATAAARLLTRAQEGMAASRAEDDPELAWLRFATVRATAQARGAISSEGRASAATAHAVLTTDPAWAAEAAVVRDWLR